MSPIKLAFAVFFTLLVLAPSKALGLFPTAKQRAALASELVLLERSEEPIPLMPLQLVISEPDRGTFAAKVSEKRGAFRHNESENRRMRVAAAY